MSRLSRRGYRVVPSRNAAVPRLRVGLFDDMRALISEHKVHQIPVAGALLLALVALPAARFALVALESHQSSRPRWSKMGGLWTEESLTYPDLALATIRASFGRLAAIDHDADRGCDVRSADDVMTGSENGMPRGECCLGV